jgi:hypothetical protein
MLRVFCGSKCAKWTNCGNALSLDLASRDLLFTHTIENGLNVQEWPLLEIALQRED